MKKISILVLLLTSITLLSGCFYNTEETPAAPTEVNADTLLDDQLYESAVRGDNAGKCDLISEAAKVGECKKVVQATLLTAKAVAEMDDDYCGDIELERYEEVCEGKVAELVEFEENVQKTQETSQEAYDTQDTDLCFDIISQMQKDTCILNILVNSETSKKEECERIKDLSFRTYCTERVKS